MSLPRRVAVAGLVCALDACTLFTDLSGFSGGATTSGDAGSDALANDGAKGETGGGADASDASDASDGAIARGCGAYPDASFCVDFDRGGDLGVPTWSGIDPNDANAAHSLTPSTAVSGPNALRFAILKSQPANACYFHTLERKFAGTYTNVRLRVSSKMTTSEAALIAKFKTATTTEYQLIAIVTSDNAILLLQRIVPTMGVTEVAQALAPTTSSAKGRWVDVELEVSRATRTAKVAIDGKSGSLAIPEDMLLLDPTLVIGPWCVDGAPVFDLDDLVAWMTK